ADRERLARFQREARLLASLNHPNIAAIHGIEEAPGEAGAEPSRALVLELVEGATLADRVLRGPLPVPEALAIARQIAEALDASHERGIVHRDLKPANVKVTPAGAVKVLDFGIAKSVAAEMPTAQMSAAETVGTTVAATRDGAVLGTVPYMSPEQARGQPVDKRTDIWAFGCVLFEMLTGRSPFQGDTVSDTIVRVLDRQPDWDSLPGETPPRVRELLRRCLDKDPQCRYRDIGDARLDLAEESGIFAADPGTAAAPAAADRGPAAPGRRRRAVAAAVAGGVLLAVVAGLWWWQGRSGEPEPINSVVVLRFESDAGDEPGEYLGEGITENLINKLSGLPGLRVVPRGIAAGYSSADLDLERLADELDVRAVVTGRVAEREGTLVVRAELTDLASVSQIWGQQYTRPLTDILSLEEELVRQISSELRLRLSPDDETRLARRDTDNPEAYRLFLRARHHVLSLSPEGLDLGLEYAHRAVAADPAYGLGHAVLADAYVARTFVGLEPHEEGFRRARAAAERALELDRTHAYPRLVNGFVLHHGEWDWEGAVRHWQAALELEPESADAHQSYSEGMASLGRLDEALEHARRAVELDPNFGNQS
ncbi:MAG: protein kinase, partial [Thermoanaerobaculia bacterium]|nr:protein kinase [Thermoanaerobaculia bacterium]